QTCDYVLYTITQEMLGFYAIAEVVDDSNKRPHKTIFCYLETGFQKHQLKSLQAIARMVKENGGQVFTSLEEVAEYLNSERLKDKTISHEENLGSDNQKNHEAIELVSYEQLEVEEQEIASSSTITQSHESKISLSETEQEEFKKYIQWNQSLQPKSEFNSNLTPSGNKALLKAIEVSDKEEKGQEVRKMRNYYDNSTVTLIAVQADMERKLFDEWRGSFLDVARGIDKEEFKKVLSSQNQDVISSETLVTSVNTYASVEKLKKTTSSDKYEKAKKYLSTQISDEKLEEEILKSSSKIVVEKSTKKDLTINDPASEVGQIKDWQKNKKTFTYTSCGYETKQVNFLKHDKSEIDKVHKLLVDISQTTDPTKLPEYQTLNYLVNYNSVPDSIKLIVIQKIALEADPTNLPTDEFLKEIASCQAIPAHILAIDSPDDKTGKISLNVKQKTFTYTSWQQTTPEEVKILEHSKIEVDKLHHILKRIERETEPTKLPDDEELKNATDYQLVPISRNLETIKKIRDEKESLLWQPFFTAHDISEENQKKLWKKSEDLSGFSIIDKQFDYFIADKKYHIDPLIHDKREVDKAHEFFISFSKEIKNKDFIDLPSYEELTNNKYNEEKVPSKLSLNELRKI
ncbi:3240_t:CDS:10, partial [Funneliformis geosporum]